MLKTFIVLCIVMLALLIIAYVVLTRIQNKGRQHTRIKNQNKSIGAKTSRFYYMLDKTFRKMFFTSKYYAKVRKKVELVTPADNYTVSITSAKIMFKSSIFAILSLVILLSLGEVDLFYIMACGLAVYVIFSHTMNSRLEKQENNLLIQFSDFLAEIRHYYHESSSNGGVGRVDEAVYETIDHSPYEMSLHATRIYDILESTDMEDEVEKYAEIAPNRFIMMFVTICVTIVKYGDKKIGADKQSVFLKNINYLKQEVNNEMLNRKKLNNKFSALVWIAVLPIFAMKPLQSLLSSWGAEMDAYFSGRGGIISTVIIFLTTMFSYVMITKLKSSNNFETKDHKILERLAKIPFIQTHLTKKIDKHYNKSVKMNECLKSVGDTMGPNLFLLKRYLFGLVGIILCNVVLFTINTNSKKDILTNFEEAFESSSISNDAYREDMKATTKTYLVTLKSYDIDYDALVADITANTSVKNVLYAGMVADEVIQRVSDYNSIYYRWYYLLICIFAGIIGYQVPLVILKYRQYLMRMAREDEVIQFHTILLILMHIDRMSVDIILEWMERFAFSFKQSISECIQDFEMGDIKALEDLKAKEAYGPFRQLVDNLIAVDKVNVANAFDEIEEERKYFMDKRKEDNEITTDKKSIIGKGFAFASIMVIMVLWVLLPFMIMSLSQFSGYSANMAGF